MQRLVNSSSAEFPPSKGGVYADEDEGDDMKDMGMMTMPGTTTMKGMQCVHAADQKLPPTTTTWALGNLMECKGNGNG